MITVERFTDPNYSRPRYCLRHSERKTYLRDGYREGSYKFKRDAQQRADERNFGYFAALAMRDGRYSIGSERAPDMSLQFAVRFCGERIATAPNSMRAWQDAGEHIADRTLVAANNPNRRPRA